MFSQQLRGTGRLLKCFGEARGLGTKAGNSADRVPDNSWLPHLPVHSLPALSHEGSTVPRRVPLCAAGVGWPAYRRAAPHWYPHYQHSSHTKSRQRASWNVRIPPRSDTNLAVVFALRFVRPAQPAWFLLRVSPLPRCGVVNQSKHSNQEVQLTNGQISSSGDGGLGMGCWRMSGENVDLGSS